MPETTTPAASTGGQARRRERNRQALLCAASRLLAEGHREASIEEITRRAGVGFGTFYNHFESKDELFGSCVFGVLDGYARWLSCALVASDDPAVTLADGFRLTGRLAQREPDLFAPVVGAGIDVLFLDRAIRSLGLDQLTAGVASGRFVDEDPAVLMLAVGGAHVALVHHLAAHPEADATALIDRLAVRLLCLLGLAADEAERIGTRPLVDVPAVGGWFGDPPHQA